MTDAAERRESRDVPADAAPSEQALRLARHDVRNHLTTILNATHYLKTRVRDTELAQQDPRIVRFLGLIEQAAADAHGSLDALRDGRLPTSAELDEQADERG